MAKSSPTLDLEKFACEVFLQVAFLQGQIEDEINEAQDLGYTE